MANHLTSTLITLGVAAAIVSLLFKLGGVLDDAKIVANQANKYQLATVLELYYSDHQRYPETQNGDSLIRELKQKGYIKNKPRDSSSIKYGVSADGENYVLDFKNN